MLLILADDLTGALDTGAQFAQRGIPVHVSVKRSGFPQATGEAMVLDLETRHIAPEQAFRVVRDAAVEGIARGYTHFYKKTDSTLRGNIGAELAGLLEACAAGSLEACAAGSLEACAAGSLEACAAGSLEACAAGSLEACAAGSLAAQSQGPLMFIPAYPGNSRTTHFGCQYVEGLPIHQTVFAADPLNPLHSSYIPSIIAEQTDIPVEVTDGNIFATSDYQTDLRKIIVFDAQDDEDLLRIGQGLNEAKQLTLTAGCAGFAAVLADLLPFLKEPSPPLGCPQQLLVICGSINPVSLEQADRAEKSGLFSRFSLEDVHFRADRLTGPVRAALQAGENVLVSTIRSPGELQISPGHRSQRQILVGLGKMVGELRALLTGLTLVVFGGDTALEIVRVLDIPVVYPRVEILPGVILSSLGTERLQLISKAGGFGTGACLLEIKKRIAALAKEG